MLFIALLSLVSQSVLATPAPDRNLCDVVGFEEVDARQIDVYKMEQSGPVIYRISYKMLGTALLNGGLDVQTTEPKDNVYVRVAPKSNPLAFELVYQDHALNSKGESVPDLIVKPCNDGANAILRAAVTAAAQ